MALVVFEYIFYPDGLNLYRCSGEEDYRGRAHSKILIVSRESQIEVVRLQLSLRNSFLQSDSAGNGILVPGGPQNT